MHAHRLLHKLLRSCCPSMHKRRRASLLACCESLLNCQIVQLTAIGRSIQSPCGIKHKIKQADRLLANTSLHNESFSLYQSFASLFVSPASQPIILIDWSDLTPTRSHFLLRASLAVEGRPLTLYEEAHTSLDNREVHRKFLNKLAELLPQEVSPILVTDAGFRGTWFKLVAAMGWDWVGRVRGRILVAWPDSDDWISCRQLMAQAGSRAKRLGPARIMKNQDIECELVSIKKLPKHRIAKTLKGERQRRKHSKEHSRSGREAWLIATSLEGISAKTLVKYYALRMQIEESFRDVKNARYGMSMEFVGSRHTNRLTVLMLLAHIVYTVLFILGSTIEEKNLQYQFQSNSIRSRRVVSVIYVALLAIRLETPLAIAPADLKETIDRIRTKIRERNY